MASGPLTSHDVLFYVPTIAPLLAGDRTAPPGGAETQVRLLAQALSGAGLRVAVVAFAWPGLPHYDGDVQVLVRPPRSAHALREAATIASVLHRHRSTVVVSRQAGAHTGMVAVVARASRRRFIYSAANVLDFDFGSWEPSKVKQILFNAGLRVADQIVVQTDEQAALGLAKFGRDLPVIRSLAEQAKPRTAAPEAFLWAGRVMDYKQPLEYLELARAVPEARFWMVAVPDDAKDSDRRLLQDLVRKAPSVANLELLPPCPRVELLDRMQRAVAVVSTSSSEGMPNIWLEGWMRGVPALTLSHDPDQLIERYGLGAAARGDRRLFAHAARGLWAERDAQADLAARCRSYAAVEHAPEAVAEKWIRAMGLRAA